MPGYFRIPSIVLNPVHVNIISSALVVFIWLWGRRDRSKAEPEFAVVLGGEPITMKQIAHSLGIPERQVRRKIDALHKGGYIKKRFVGKGLAIKIRIPPVKCRLDQGPTENGQPNPADLMPYPKPAGTIPSSATHGHANGFASPDMDRLKDPPPQTPPNIVLEDYNKKPITNGEVDNRGRALPTGVSRIGEALTPMLQNAQRKMLANQEQEKLGSERNTGLENRAAGHVDYGYRPATLDTIKWQLSNIPLHQRPYLTRTLSETLSRLTLAQLETVFSLAWRDFGPKEASLHKPGGWWAKSLVEAAEAQLKEAEKSKVRQCS